MRHTSLPADEGDHVPHLGLHGAWGTLVIRGAVLRRLAAPTAPDGAGALGMPSTTPSSRHALGMPAPRARDWDHPRSGWSQSRPTCRRQVGWTPPPP